MSSPLQYTHMCMLMYVCLWGHVYMCMYMCIYMCVCVRMCVHCLCKSICQYIYMSVCSFAHAHINESICDYMCVTAFMYEHLDVCTLYLCVYQHFLPELMSKDYDLPMFSDQVLMLKLQYSLHQICIQTKHLHMIARGKENGEIEIKPQVLLGCVSTLLGKSGSVLHLPGRSMCFRNMYKCGLNRHGDTSSMSPGQVFVKGMQNE